MTTVRAVEAQYDEFPYPQPEHIAQQLPADFDRGVLNFLLRRRVDAWLPADSEVWIAGCGTQQACMFALSNPAARVLATDLSERVLGIATGLAQQLGITNVRFDKQDISESSFHERFDLVVSTGVLHHLPQPEIGVAKVAEALKPSGAAVLMVYSAMHRAPLVGFRRSLNLLASDDEDADRRYELACRLLDELLNSERCDFPRPGALRVLWEKRETDRPFVADALLHPLEHTYDVDGFFELLRASGLEHRSWLHPAQWDVDTYVRSPELLERLRRLEPLDQYRAVYELAGCSGPLLEAVVEKIDRPAAPPYHLDELLGMRVICSQGMLAHVTEQGKVVRTVRLAPFEVKEGQLEGRARGAYGLIHSWQAPEVAKELLELADGTRTVGELLDAFSDRADRQETLQLIAGMLPADIGMLAPC